MGTRLITFNELSSINATYTPKGCIGHHSLRIIGKTRDSLTVRGERGKLKYRKVHMDEFLKAPMELREVDKHGNMLMGYGVEISQEVTLRKGDVLHYNCGEIYKLPAWRAEIYQAGCHLPIKLVSPSGLEEETITHVDSVLNSYGRCVSLEGSEIIQSGEGWIVKRLFYDNLKNNMGKGDDIIYALSKEAAQNAAKTYCDPTMCPALFGGHTFVPTL